MMKRLPTAVVGDAISTLVLPAGVAPPASLDHHRNPRAGTRHADARRDPLDHQGRVVSGAEFRATALTGRLPPGAGRRPDPPRSETGQPCVNVSSRWRSLLRPWRVRPVREQW
jgi:hypothetical protein